MTLKTYSGDDLQNFDKNFRREFVNALSGAKPAMLVGTTERTQQVHNLSLVSNVLHIGSNPPLMGVLFRPDVVPRHTLSNIRTTGYYTLNHVSEALVEPAHIASAKYEMQTSEFEASNLQPAFTHTLPAPYVAEAQVQIGLKLEEQLDIQTNGTHLVVGRIIEVRLPESAVQDDGYIALDKLASISVVGLQGYQRLVPHSRMGYIRPGQTPEEVQK